MKDKLLITLLACIISFSSQAQFTKWSLSGGLGITSYAGDLDGTGISNMKPALNFEAWYKLHENIQIKAGTSLYQLAGNDHVASRNRSFRANHYELYAAAMIVFPVDRLDFFTYIGGGITKVDPEGISPGWIVDLPVYDVEGQSMESTALIMPVGLGFRYKVTPTFAVVFDAGYRLTNTDYLDGVSRFDIPVNSLSRAAVSYHNSVRNNDINTNASDNATFRGGNPDLNDLYGIFSIKLQYIIPSKGMNLNNALPRLRR